MYLSDCVCLCVCLCLEYLRNYGRILIKFFGEAERGPGRNRLGFFGGDRDFFVDPGFFQNSVPLGDRA